MNEVRIGIGVWSAAGNPTRYAYDRFGRLAAVTNALGHATVYEYDLRGRKTYEGGATYPVRYTYDVFGNKMTMMTYRDESRGPDSGDVTTWLYDEASGVMTNKVYADGKGPRYDYDAIGRLAKRTWARGIDTFYAYDGWGNLTNTTYSDETPTIALKYDALGRQIAAHDAAGVTTFAYDDFGANTNETVVGVAGTNVLERFADEFGRDAGYALNGERRTIIGHDLATGRIATMQVAGCTNAFRWSYHSGCDLKHTLLYPNGALVTWEYEPHRDLMTLVSNDVYSIFRYTYDEAGKRVSKNDERYGYNARGELVFATNIVTGAEFAYWYDDIGNRLWSREFGTNCTYVANELNQYTNIIRGGVFEFSAFDLDGNQTNIVTSTGEWSVEYNGENRPVMWSRASDGTAIRMAYDRKGRRVVKNDGAFVYDNYLNIGKTIWDPTEPVATRPLSLFRKRSVAVIFHDSGKNVVNIISSSVCAQVYSYCPYGKSAVNHMCADECLMLWGYSSECLDVDSDVLCYSFREYNIDLGRWLSRDKIGEIGGFNLYGFINNAPVAFQDILGNGIVEWIRCLWSGGTYSNGKCCCNGNTMDYTINCCKEGKQYDKEGVEVAREYKVRRSDARRGGLDQNEMHYWLEWGEDERVEANEVNNGRGRVLYLKGVPHTIVGYDPNAPYVEHPPELNRAIKASKCRGEDPDKFRSCLTRMASSDNGKELGKLCYEYDSSLIDSCREESKK